MRKKSVVSKWNLDILGEGVDDPRFEKERSGNKRRLRRFINRWKEDESYLEDVESLLLSLEQYEALETSSVREVNEGFYLGLRSALETDNVLLKAAENKYRDYYTPLYNQISFYLLNLARVSPEVQKKFLADERLAHYHFFLKELFAGARHNLSESEENLTALLHGVMAGNWEDMTDEFLARSTEIVLVEKSGKLVEQELSFNEFIGKINSPIREVRDSAAVAVNSVLDRLGDIYEKEFNTFLERKKIYDRLRGYSRPDEYRHLADSIKSSTVDTMLGVVTDNLKIARDYYAFKAQVMGVSRLAYHERNVPLGEVATSFTYPKSVSIVQNAFARLDSEFAEIFDMFATGGRIDAFPRRGKTSGAFCAGSAKDTPSYILLNHHDDINSLTTLAHESGHGIHNELMRPVQSPLYCHTSLATAEVASTFCEEFALREAMQEMSEEERFVALGESLNGHISAVIRQAVFYLFEQELHATYRKEGYLSKKQIGKIFHKHMKSYMGRSVLQDSGSENWWMYVGHFRRPFYVYSYASGEMIAMSLQQMVYEKPEAIEKVKKILRAGASDTAENIFKGAGIDITRKEFWEQAMKQMKQDLVDLKTMAKQLGKI